MFLGILAGKIGLDYVGKIFPNNLEENQIL